MKEQINKVRTNVKLRLTLATFWKTAIGCLLLAVYIPKLAVFNLGLIPIGVGIFYIFYMVTTLIKNIRIFS